MYQCASVADKMKKHFNNVIQWIDDVLKENNKNKNDNGNHENVCVC